MIKCLSDEMKQCDRGRHYDAVLGCYDLLLIIQKEDHLADPGWPQVTETIEWGPGDSEILHEIYI